jgi:hypothetical protein
MNIAISCVVSASNVEVFHNIFIPPQTFSFHVIGNACKYLFIVQHSSWAPEVAAAASSYVHLQPQENVTIPSVEIQFVFFLLLNFSPDIVCHQCIPPFSE